MKKSTSLKEKEVYLNQIRSWNDKAWKYNRTSPKEAINLAEKALELAKEIDEYEQLAISKFIIGTSQVWISKYEQALQNIFDARKRFREMENSLYEAKCDHSLGACYYYLFDFDESLKWFESSLEGYEKLNDAIGLADAYNGIGSAYHEMGNYQQALETLEKGAKTIEGIDAPHIYAKIIQSMGETTSCLKDYEASTTHFVQSIKLSEKEKLYQLFVIANEGLANICIEKQDYESGLKYTDAAINTARRIEFKIGLTKSLFLKGHIFLNQNMEPEAFEYFDEAIHISQEIEDIEVLHKFHELLANHFEKKEDFKQASYHLRELYSVEKKLSDQRNSLYLKSLRIKSNMERIEKENEIIKIKNRELEFRTEYLKESNDRIKTISEIGQVIASKLDLEELLNAIYNQINTLMRADVLYIGIHNAKDETIEFPFYFKRNRRIYDLKVSMNDTGKFTVWCIKNKRDVVLNDFHKEASNYITLMDYKDTDRVPSSVLILPIKIQEKIIGVIGVHSIEKNSFKKEKVDILRALNAYVSIALENAKIHKNINDLYALIENKNREIIDSINYSKRLQDAILTPWNLVKKSFNHSFMIFRPKDVVSGDFYWFEQVNGVSYIAVADCTGHGVPGAMVSLVCHNALSRSLNEFGMHEPHMILDKTRELIIDTFAQSTNGVRDGMDISLCAIHNDKLRYSGAYNPLWIVRKTRMLSPEEKNDDNTVIHNDMALIKLNADRQPVGLSELMSEFTQHEVQLYRDDVIYLFTDGFADQFGGEHGKKFKRLSLKKLLIRINSKPMSEQKDIIENAFEKWKGDLEQIDDVCIVGVKV